MDDEIDWQGIENSCPENRQLAEVIRWLGRFHGGDSSIDWQESRRRRAHALTAFLEASQESHALIARLQGADYEIGGDEHFVVRVDERT